jgi:hypothetical protein
MDLIKTKEDNDYTNSVLSAYSMIIDRFNYRATISNLLEIIKSVLGKKEWDILDPNQTRNVEFESYVMDKVIDFNNGKAVNFTQLEKDLLTYGDFTAEEKYQFYENHLEEILWAIFLVLGNINITYKTEI